MDEKTLAQRLRDPQTRRQAFNTLVTQNSEQIYWTVRHIVGRHDLADDAVQNTFLKAWNSLDNFRGDAKLSTWLHSIAVNEAIDLMRREKKYADNDSDYSALDTAYADEYFEGDEAEQLLRRAMETLPEAQRAVFSLKYFEDKQYKEISEILGTSVGGLKANFHHAVEKIKRFMDIG